MKRRKVLALTLALSLVMSLFGGFPVAAEPAVSTITQETANHQGSLTIMLDIVEDAAVSYLAWDGTSLVPQTLGGVRFAVLRRTRLAAVTVNPVSAGGWRFDGTEFLETMRAAVAAPVLNVEDEDGTEL